LEFFAHINVHFAIRGPVCLLLQVGDPRPAVCYWTGGFYQGLNGHT